MEQMGPLNYKIRGRGKVQIVNVRRLIKYDPFLLEDESVEEALKRMKEDFKEVPPISKEDTLEEENAYRAPVSEKEETEKESKEDSNRKSAAGTQSKAPIVRGAILYISSSLSSSYLTVTTTLLYYLSTYASVTSFKSGLCTKPSGAAGYSCWAQHCAEDFRSS
eukprot:g25590.t1